VQKKEVVDSGPHVGHATPGAPKRGGRVEIRTSLKNPESRAYQRPRPRAADDGEPCSGCGAEDVCYDDCDAQERPYKPPLYVRRAAGPQRRQSGT